MQRARLIGGLFGLESPLDPHETPPPFIDERSLLLANASSALWLIVNTLRPPRVWLPSYLCRSLVQAISATPATPQFYPVGSDLVAHDLGWLEETAPHDAIVVIDYFGFSNGLMAELRTRSVRATIIEDASQALLTKSVGQHADMILYSPRKFVGVPDGGIISGTKDLRTDDGKLERPPANWWLTAFAASMGRGEFDRHGGNRDWFDLFRQAENQHPVGAYSMSQLSETLLKNCIDYAAIVDKRRRNYRTLLDALGNIAIFPELPESVVPLGFPVRVDERDTLRQSLFDEQIYPPVHWDIRGVVPESFTESHDLASEIMTLPCDQRYDDEDMSKLANSVSRNLGICR